MVRRPLQDHPRRAGQGIHLQKPGGTLREHCSLSAQLAGLWDSYGVSVSKPGPGKKITEVFLVQFCPLITEALGCNVGLTRTATVPEHTSGTPLPCYSRGK